MFWCGSRAFSLSIAGQRFLFRCFTWWCQVYVIGIFSECYRYFFGTSCMCNATLHLVDFGFY